MVMGVGSRNGQHLGDAEPSDGYPGMPEDAEETGDAGDTAASDGNRVGLWVLGALLLLILSVTVFVSALGETSDDGAPQQQAALEGAASEASRPTSADQAATVTAQLASLVGDVEKKYGVTAGVSLQAGGGVVHAGEIEDARAWSTVKVPIALAAVQKGLADGTADDLTDDIGLALTMSDNDAALRLWETLGTDEQSSAAVDDIFRQAGDPTDAEGDRAREDYGGFGDIHWSLDNQVIFANRLGCLDGADRVLDQMGQVVPEHRRGLGLLPGARFKGGWGDEPDGTYLLREFGLVGAKDRQVPVSVAVLPDDASDATARQAAGALAEALAPMVTALADQGGVAQCQVPASVPAASTEAPVDVTGTADTVDTVDAGV